MKPQGKDRSQKITAAGKDRVYRIVSNMIAEKTGETPEEVLDRMSRRAVALQRQRRDRARSQRATKRSGFIPNTDEKIAAKALT